VNAYNVATSFYSQKANIWLYWQIGLFIMAVGSLSNSLVHGVVDLFDFLSNGTDSYDLGPVSRLSD
jgi:hypothetical protein